MRSEAVEAHQPVATALPPAPLESTEDDLVIDRDRALIVLTLRGEFGNLTLAAVEANIHTLLYSLDKGNGSWKLVIDCDSIRYVGARPLGLIVRLGKRVHQQGGVMVFCNVSTSVNAVLRATNLHSHWPIFSTRRRAIEAVDALQDIITFDRAL